MFVSQMNIFKYNFCLFESIKIKKNVQFNQKQKKRRRLEFVGVILL